MANNALFPFNYFFVKLFSLILIISFKYINSESIPNFQVFYLSENEYIIIDAQNIYFYNSTSETRTLFYPLVGNEIITSVDESEMINLGKFKNTDAAHILIVKNHVLVYFNATKFGLLENEQINNYKSQVFP